MRNGTVPEWTRHSPRELRLRIVRDALLEVAALTPPTAPGERRALARASRALETAIELAAPDG